MQDKTTKYFLFRFFAISLLLINLWKHYLMGCVSLPFHLQQLSPIPLILENVHVIVNHVHCTSSFIAQDHSLFTTGFWMLNLSKTPYASVHPSPVFLETFWSSILVSTTYFPYVWRLLHTFSNFIYFSKCLLGSHIWRFPLYNFYCQIIYEGLSLQPYFAGLDFMTIFTNENSDCQSGGMVIIGIFCLQECVIYHTIPQIKKFVLAFTWKG